MKGIKNSIIYTHEMNSNLRIRSMKMIKTKNNKTPHIFIVKELLLEAEFKKIVFAYNYTICGDGLKVQYNDYQSPSDMPGSECIRIQYK